MGRVHSTFDTSLNIDMDGFLFHIGYDGAPLSCLGTSVSTEEIASLLGVVERGDRVVLHDGRLCLYGRLGTVELDLSSGPVRACEVRAPEGEIFEGIDRFVFRLLSGCELVSASGLPESERSHRALAELARYAAICSAKVTSGVEVPRFRLEAATRGLYGSVEYLIGRGLGLTPSGDDVLCGFGTGLRYLCGSDYLEGWQRFASYVRDSCSGRTTAVSEAYLRAMTEGCANADYLDLLCALSAKDGASASATVEGVLGVGHTSGADSLLGFGAAFCCLFD